MQASPRFTPHYPTQDRAQPPPHPTPNVHFGYWSVHAAHNHAPAICEN